MVVPGGVRDLERHHDLGMERGRALRPAVVAGAERESADIVALRDRWSVLEQHRQTWFDALPAAAVAEAIRYKTYEGAAGENPQWQILQHMANRFEPHRDGSRRQAALEIEHVRRDPAHPPPSSSLSSLSRVIFICSSAAIRISRSGEWGRRARSSESISSALLPVAHTMKI